MLTNNESGKHDTKATNHMTETSIIPKGGVSEVSPRVKFPGEASAVFISLSNIVSVVPSSRHCLCKDDNSYQLLFLFFSGGHNLLAHFDQEKTG